MAIRTRSLILASAAVEAGTGLALLLLPRLVVRALLGTGLSRSGVATSRVAGLALVSLGVACWPETAARPASSDLPPFRALFVYNGLATAYLASLRARGGYRGIALGPATAFHAVMTALFATHSRTPRSASPLPPAR